MRKLLIKYNKENNEINDLKKEIRELNIRLKNNKNLCSICYEK